MSLKRCVNVDGSDMHFPEKRPFLFWVGDFSITFSTNVGSRPSPCVSVSLLLPLWDCPGEAPFEPGDVRSNEGDPSAPLTLLLDSSQSMKHDVFSLIWLSHFFSPPEAYPPPLRHSQELPQSFPFVSTAPKFHPATLPHPLGGLPRPQRRGSASLLHSRRSVTSRGYCRASTPRPRWSMQSWGSRCGDNSKELNELNSINSINFEKSLQFKLNKLIQQITVE